LSNPKPKVTTINDIGDDAHHILLVDDDSDYLALIGRWLKKDYRVSTINSGEQALAYLQTETPDLVLLDYAMPEVSGVEVLEQIRSNQDTADLPVVFLTGTEDRKIVKAAEALKPQGFLLKSMGKSELLMAVEHFFAE
ncbi:MAG: response regulator, partial [Eubacterium sp.]|nr:response regulator [Eubacterium sp.]